MLEKRGEAGGVNIIFLLLCGLAVVLCHGSRVFSCLYYVLTFTCSV